MAGPNGAIAAGSILTAGGTATAISAVTLGAMLIGAGKCMANIPFWISSVSCAAATPILLAIGIPLLVTGVIKKNKKIKKFRMQQKLDAAQAEVRAVEL